MPRPAVAAVSAAVVVVASLALVPSLASPGDLPCSRDLLDFFLPMKAELARAARFGSVPFWDPWTLGGTPFFASLQSQVFYPPNWIFGVVELPWALSLFIALHFVVGGLGARALARSLGASPAAAALAGLAFACGGFVASLSDLSNQQCAAAWMPWTSAAAVRFAGGGGRSWLAAWAAAGSLQFLAGEPQLAVLGGLLSLALAVHRAGLLGRLRGVAKGAVLAGTLALGACAVQAVPFAELVLASDRMAGDAVDPGRDHGLGPRPLRALVTAPAGPFSTPAGPLVRSVYLGPAVLMLAAIGACRRGAHRVLAVAALVSFVLAAAPTIPPLADLLRDATPWLRYPAKYFAVAAACIPLLAAGGLDLAIEAARRLGLARSGVLAAALVTLVAVDLVHAHRPLLLALPAEHLLADTAALRLLQAETASDGPRVHPTGVTAERLARRARRLAEGDVLGAYREKVELLEGALPAVFAIHATTGGAALTVRSQADLIADADRSGSPEALARLGAAYVLSERGLALPQPFELVPVDGGAADLHVVPGRAFPPRRTWRGPNTCIGPAGMPAPSAYPGWREGPPGTWTFRPTGFVPLGIVSLASWLLIAAMILLPRRVASRPGADEPGLFVNVRARPQDR